MDTEMLTDGERYMLGERIDLLLRSEDDPKLLKARTRRLAEILGRYYRGRLIEFAGEGFWVDDRTPAGSISRKLIESVG